MPLSITLLLAAAGIPRFLPAASPRRVARAGLLALLAGILLLLVTMDVDAGAEIVTVPLLLAGLGIGALASQLGSVTVSAVPDDQSTEVGGLQNTATNLGASLGTALAGSVMIAILTASFVAGIEQNDAVPSQVSAQAEVELASGIPFVSDADLEKAMHEAGASAATTSAVVEENGKARLVGLQSALAAMAVMALLALFFTGRVPEEQPGLRRGGRPEPEPAAAT
jgi:predicted MFS family arabinose efflux permease